MTTHGRGSDVAKLQFFTRSNCLSDLHLLVIIAYSSLKKKYDINKIVVIKMGQLSGTRLLLLQVDQSKHEANNLVSTVMRKFKVKMLWFRPTYKYKKQFLIFTVTQAGNFHVVENCITKKPEPINFIFQF